VQKFYFEVNGHDSSFLQLLCITLHYRLTLQSTIEMLKNGGFSMECMANLRRYLELDFLEC
jgi:hypothetical protein